jgi:transposase
VKPYVKSNKSDIIDAEAIAEAATRPSMRFVEIKSETQVDIQALHRVRDHKVSARTRLVCQMRAFVSNTESPSIRGSASSEPTFPECSPMKKTT